MPGGILAEVEEKIPPPMQSNFLVKKTEKAVVVANYHSPDFTYEKVSTETVKCGAIVEVCQGRFTPFAIRVWLNVNPIFGRILWQRICVSEHFCVNLTSWLFHQWRGIKESNGKGATQSCVCIEMADKKRKRNFFIASHIAYMLTLGKR